jgi:hypothetical protein
MNPDAIKEAHLSLIQAIAELKAANVPVPLALHKAAHALSHALSDCSIVPIISTS